MTGPDARPEYAWLIERGQNEGQAPTVWLNTSNMKTNLYSDCEWFEDANKATRFPSREAAEEMIARIPVRWARAVEHGWLDARPPAGPAADPRIETIRQALEDGGFHRTTEPSLIALDSLAADLARHTHVEETLKAAKQALREAASDHPWASNLLDQLTEQSVYWTARFAEAVARHAQTVEALEQAVILEYDPSKTDEQNAELHRRAEVVRAALAADTDSEQART